MTTVNRINNFHWPLVGVSSIEINLNFRRWTKRVSRKCLQIWFEHQWCYIIKISSSSSFIQWKFRNSKHLSRTVRPCRWIRGLIPGYFKLKNEMFEPNFSFANYSVILRLQKLALQFFKFPKVLILSCVASLDDMTQQH